MKSTVEVLRGARALISDERNWCGTGWGRGDSRCALHALGVAGAVENPAAAQGVARSAYEALRRQVGEVGRFNDTHKHADVLALFDTAIANEEAKAQEFTVDVLDAVEVVA